MTSTEPSEIPGTFSQRAAFLTKYYLVLVWGFFCTLGFLGPALLFWGSTRIGWAYAHTLSWVALRLLGVRVEVTGREHLAHRPAILVANHQSNYDALLVGAVYPRDTVVIGKKELRDTPLFGTFFAATGNILIDRADHKDALAGLDKAVEAVRSRRVSIWVFPEGQRSRGTGLGAFKKGAFHMAIAAGVPEIPIVYSSIDRVINARARRAAGGVIKIHILPPVSTEGMRAADTERLKDKVHAMFREEWSRLEPAP